jgi:anti-anti-sigma factor
MTKRVLPEPESPDGADGVARADPSRALLPPCLTVETHDHRDRVTVVVAGELDIDTEEALQNALRDALRRSVSGIDLDLSGVIFCDCSGLNVLLAVRRRALEDAKTVVLGATGPAVDRLLSLTGTRSLFGPVGNAISAVNGYERVAREQHRSPEEDERPDDTDPDQDLHVELVQLRRAMQTRPVIDLARGVLMASFELSPDDAWSVLVAVSQNTNTKLHHVAEGLVAAVNGDAPPGPVQHELAAAVTALKGPPAEPAGAVD